MPIISSIANTATSVFNTLTNTRSSPQPTLTTPNGTIIGTSAGKSQVQQFHDFLLSDIGNIPLATQWVLQIDTLPTALLSNPSSPNVNNLEPGDWFVDGRAKAIKKAISEGAFLDKGVCIFAQGVQTPGESVNIQRIGPNDSFQGGLLGAPVAGGRSPLPELNIAFLETNYSFLDFIVRPWVIYTGHYGLIARKPDDVKNIKTTLQVFFYDRGGDKAPKVRKIFRFYNAAPVRMEGIISTWDDQEVKKIYTSWTYTHYDVSAESITDALNDIHKAGDTNRFIANAKTSFTPPSKPLLPSTALIKPTPPTGSEAFSNPATFSVPSQTPPNLAFGKG